MRYPKIHSEHGVIEEFLNISDHDIDIFLSEIEGKMNELESDICFYKYFDWEKVSALLNKINAIEQLVKDKKVVLAMDVGLKLESVKRMLWDTKRVLAHERLRKRIRDLYVDKPVTLYRGIRNFSGDDATVGEVNWWSADLEKAREYAGEKGKVFDLKITLKGTDEVEWIESRGHNRKGGQYTFGISEGNDGHDGGFVMPTYFCIGTEYSKENGVINELE